MINVEDFELLRKYQKLKDLSPLEKVTVMEKRVIIIRWLGILIGIITVPFLGLREIVPIYLLIGYALLHNVFFQFVIIPYRNYWLLKPVVLTLGDNIMASAAVYLTGGLQSDFYLIYFLLAVLSAIRFGRREAIISTTISTTFYILIVYKEGYNLTSLNISAEIILRMGFVVITGIFVGYLGDRTRQIELDLQKELDKAHSQLNKSTALLNQNLELEDVLKTGVDQARKLIDADFSIILMEGTSVKFQPHTFRENFLNPYYPSERMIHPFLEKGVQYLSRLFPELTRASQVEQHNGVDGKKEVSIVDCTADAEMAKVFSKEEGCAYHLITIPLMSGEKKLGTLFLVKFNHTFKPLRDSQVDLVVLYSISISTAVTNSLIYAQSRLQAITDPVTGLYNHRFLHETIKLELDKCLFDKMPLSLIVLDIDSFKQFNDTYGHSVGDIALKSVANMIQESIHGKGLAARYGGDEFVIVLPYMSNKEACDVAESIRRKAFDLPHIPSHEALSSLYISLGVATAPQSGETPEKLFNAADSALYLAKFTGKNIVKSALELSDFEIFSESSVFPNYSESKKMKSLQKAFSKNSTLDFEMIEAFIAAVDAKDHYTYNHSDSVSIYAIKLARKMKLSEVDVEKVRLGALLHDIGKIGIPDNIISKGGKLTSEEYEIIKQHPVIGAKIIQPIKSMRMYSPIIMHHHEWFNGKGYPNGLKGSEIPLEARIVSICDTYDAMTTDRPYRRAMNKEKALKIIEELVGQQFDPDVWIHFNEMMTKNDKLLSAE